MRLLPRLPFVALLSTLVCTASQAAPPPLPVVRHLDPARYAGTWYEIAHLPLWVEIGCKNSVDTYTLATDDPQRLRAVHTCHRFGFENRLPTELYPPDAREPGRMVEEVGAAGLALYFDYDVVALDPLYHWAVVGEPNRRYAWILARKPSLPPLLLRALAARLDAIGYTRTASRFHCVRQEAAAKDASCQQAFGQ
jgi:apolipoprotein D and lipocalin family protein